MYSKLLILLLNVHCLIVFINSEKIRFDNFHAYQVNPRTENDINFLYEFEDIHYGEDRITFLNGIHHINETINVIVSPDIKSYFKDSLNKQGIQYRLIDGNIQSTIDEEDSAFVKTRATFGNKAAGYTWRTYHSLEETYRWLDELVKLYPNLLTPLVGGYSYERRQIRGVKLSFNTKNKTSVVLEAGMHAREWIAPVTVTYILNELLTSRNPKVRKIAESHDWYIFPHVNPDGYVYTQTTNRMWRKTRSVNGRCFGADPNRNWGYHWAEVGVSNNPCADTYAGRYAFSEVETKSYSEFLKSIAGNLKTYIAFHAYSQLLLFPYGHTRTRVKNYEQLMRIGNAAKRALAQRYGTKYTLGSVYEAIYPASGSSADWAYGALGVPISYTYELRPSNTGWNGFILPASQIIPTAEETLDSVMALLSEARNLGYYY